ncbi:MAG: PilN domain-containing protein [Pseudomonadota bacterium]
MIKINLLLEKKEIYSAESLIVYGIFLAVGLVLVGVICYFLSMSVDYRVKKLDKVIKERQTKLAEVNKVKEQVNALKAEKETIDAKMNTTRTLLKGRVDAVKLLERISSLCADEVWFTVFGKSGDNIKFDGLAKDPVNVSEFLERLKQAPYFKEVKLNSIGFIQENPLQKASFSISLKLVEL